MWFTLAALVVPLGLDTFAVAAALGISGLPRRDRLRVTLLFTAFETAMPVIGFLGVQAFVVAQLGLRLGARIGEGIREGAERLAGVALAGLGLVLLAERLLR